MSKPYKFILFFSLFPGIILFSCCGNLQQNDPGKFAGVSPGESLYKQYCLSCHKSNGSGVPDLYPSLTGKIIKGDKDTLIKVVLLDIKREALKREGNYKQGVPGQDFLTDQEITFIINYVRMKFGKVDDPVTINEVAVARIKFQAIE